MTTRAAVGGLGGLAKVAARVTLVGLGGLGGLARVAGLAGLAGLAGAGCANAPAADPTPQRASARPRPTASASASVSAAAPDAPAAPEPPHVSLEAARASLLLAGPLPAASSCPGAPREAAMRCLLEARYAADPKARALAVSLYERTGSVAGLERAHDMDGGYRGVLHLVPELPIHHERRHLEWIEAAMASYATFLSEVGARATKPLGYRASAILFRFTRSVGARTPSAYASQWSIGWNVAGSLHGSKEAVDETLWHEIFHLNDEGRGPWSSRALGALHADIKRRCGEKTSCLAPYSPGDTMVRGGTYYSFHLDNGPGEYGAELAVRYRREQLAMLAGKKLTKRAFKCGPAENQRAWRLFVDELMGGVDLVPPCP